MQTNNVINNMNGVSNPVQAQKSNQLSQDDFIKILLTQMRLQTPQNPFDSNSMMQQMSQLTNLSATKEMEKAVATLNTNLGANQVLAASQLVGKKVQVANELSPLTATEGLKGSLILPESADNIIVTIRDQNNKVVKTLPLGASEAGVVDFKWDGLDADNKACNPAYYKMSVSAMINGQNVAIPTAGTFNVNSVALDKNGNGVILNLDGIGGINMKDLIKIL